MLEEGRLEADPQVGLLPVTMLLWREGDTLGLNLTPPLKIETPPASNTVSSCRGHALQHSP